MILQVPLSSYNLDTYIGVMLLHLKCTKTVSEHSSCWVICVRGFCGDIVKGIEVVIAGTFLV